MDLNSLPWRKSSHSEDHGGDCVELAPLWRKSSYSESNGGECVELAARRARVAVRDSKHPDAGTLLLTHRAFGGLVTALRG